MFNAFKKVQLSTLVALCSLGITASLTSWDDCEPSPCNRLYIGGFGGGIYSDTTHVTQLGTAFFTEAEGGPLAVIANGHLKSKAAGLGGVQVGYEWSHFSDDCGCSDWSLAPALELEAYFFSNKRNGHLINPTTRLPEHDFYNSFDMRMSVILANAVFSINSPCLCGFSPYVGGGIGAAHISLKNAKSLQVSPIEPGIDHFNSRRNDSSWGFAAQAKAGLRYQICDSFHIFGEYRYLFVDSSNYIFGSTDYPTHAPTSPWNVKVHEIHYNAWVLGLQYDL